MTSRKMDPGEGCLQTQYTLPIGKGFLRGRPMKCKGMVRQNFIETLYGIAFVGRLVVDAHQLVPWLCRGDALVASYRMAAAKRCQNYAHDCSLPEARGQRVSGWKPGTSTTLSNHDIPQEIRLLPDRSQVIRQVRDGTYRATERENALGTVEGNCLPQVVVCFM